MTGSSPPVYDRQLLLDELARRYGAPRGSPGYRVQQARFLWKKYAWIGVTGGAHAIKRTIDIVAAGSGFILLAPVFILVAALIKLTDGGPVFYFQTRVGQYGREFRFPKFRSMVTSSDALREQLLARSDLGTSITFKMKHDPRITWIGRLIRKFSVDELPQLWCVLVGDMTLVGPRPPIPKEVAQYTLRDRRRLDVVPGLTCIWQVSGRSDIPFPQQVQLDTQYIDSQSLWLDFKLLFKTVPAVLFGRGAY